MNIAEDLIKDKNRALVSVPTGTTIAEAVAVMHTQNVGCILVERDSAYVGIWTERDLLRGIAADGFDIGSCPVDDYMHSPLLTCQWNDSVYKLMDKFLGLRVRHLVVARGDEYLGLLSAGDVMKASIREKNRELAQLNASMSWDYYEEWKHV